MDLKNLPSCEGKELYKLYMRNKLKTEVRIIYYLKNSTPFRNKDKQTHLSETITLEKSYIVSYTGDLITNQHNQQQRYTAFNNNVRRVKPMKDTRIRLILTE